MMKGRHYEREFDRLLNLQKFSQTNYFKKNRIPFSRNDNSDNHRMRISSSPIVDRVSSSSMNNFVFSNMKQINFQDCKNLSDDNRSSHQRRFMSKSVIGFGNSKNLALSQSSMHRRYK